MTIMEQYKKDYYRSCGETYKEHVDKFIIYIKNIAQKADAPISINVDDVKKCVKYYSDRGRINTRNTMELHLESIKSFYAYLSENNKAHNIFKDKNYENFKEELFKYCKLSEGEKRGTFPLGTIKEILLKIDNRISNGNLPKKEFIIYILRIFIKLTLIAPAKRGIICSIKFSDFIDDFSYLNINETTVRLPEGLRKNVIETIHLFDKNFDYESRKNDLLFEFLYGKKFNHSSLNGWFYTFLKNENIINTIDKKETYKTEIIRNTAIKSMINNNVNLVVISKISGVKIATLEKNYYSDLNDTFYNDAVNKAITKMDYYKYI